MLFLIPRFTPFYIPAKRSSATDSVSQLFFRRDITRRFTLSLGFAAFCLNIALSRIPLDSSILHLDQCTPVSANGNAWWSDYFELVLQLRLKANRSQFKIVYTVIAPPSFHYQREITFKDLIQIFNFLSSERFHMPSQSCGLGPSFLSSYRRRFERDP